MKITKDRLKQIIREEARKLQDALPPVTAPGDELIEIVEGNFEQAYRDEIEKDARDAGIPEEKIEGMSDDELIAAIHRAMSLR